MSQQIKFENLYNTRDLGGMKAAGGRTIRSGMLYRSGHLVTASVGDIKKLSEMGISLIVDFRDAGEVGERPDPEIEGARHVWLPALETPVAVISHDEESEEKMSAFMRHLNLDPDFGRTYLIDTYRDLAENSFTAAQYSKFLNLVLENNTGATLWHCTAGKDRAGVASIIIEHILGVSEDDILQDYLKTNEFLKPEIDAIFSMMIKRRADLNLPAYRYLYIAHEDYYDSLCNSIMKKYGSWEAFLVNGLKIDEKKQTRFRKKFLKGE